MITWPTSMLWTPGPPPDMATVMPTGPEERCCKDVHQYKVFVCHWLSLFVTTCHRLSQLANGCQRLSQIVTACQRLSQKLSQLVRVCQRLSQLSQLEAGYLEGSRVAIVVLVLSAEARWPCVVGGPCKEGCEDKYEYHVRISIICENNYEYHHMYSVVGGPCKEGWGGRCCKDQWWQR